LKPANEFVLLNKHHDRKDFNCGRAELNRFIKEFAAKNAELNISKTFVLPSVNGAQICSFYTLSPSELKRQTIPDKSFAKKYPGYPLPVFLIAQLAVELRCQKIGLGGITLIDALNNCLKMSKLMPAMAVVVDALDESAYQFYERYGFHELEIKDATRPRLYISMNDVKALLEP